MEETAAVADLAPGEFELQLGALGLIRGRVEPSSIIEVEKRLGGFMGLAKAAVDSSLGFGQVVTLIEVLARPVMGLATPKRSEIEMAVLESGLVAVLCVGETLDERTAGHQDIVTARQVRTALAEIPASYAERLVIAYEPVWAIGTGKTATPQDAQDAHVQIRQLIERLYGRDTAHRLRIIYGGSLKPDIAPEILAQPDVDGGLVGGASLNAADFVSLAKSAAAAGRAKR